MFYFKNSLLRKKKKKLFFPFSLNELHLLDIKKLEIQHIKITFY